VFLSPDDRHIVIETEEMIPMVNQLSIVCVCKGCGNRYVLGVNAVVVTADDVLRDLTRRGDGSDLGRPSSGVPDTIALEAGQETWPSGEPPPILCDPGSPEVVSARERGEYRRWVCDKCKTVQEYPWCSSNGPVYEDRASHSRSDSKNEASSTEPAFAQKGSLANLIRTTFPTNLFRQVYGADELERAVARFEELFRNDREYLLAVEGTHPESEAILLSDRACYHLTNHQAWSFEYPRVKGCVLSGSAEQCYRLEVFLHGPSHQTLKLRRSDILAGLKKVFLQAASCQWSSGGLRRPDVIPEQPFAGTGKPPGNDDLSILVSKERVFKSGCDAHGAVFQSDKEMSPGEGYLFGAGFIQRSIIQEKLLDRDMPMMKNIGYTREQYRLETESIQGSSPWLICEECLRVLKLSPSDKSAAREAAKRWWRDKSTPGHVPGASATRDNKPACFLIFGNGFTPSEGEAMRIILAWTEKRKGVLDPDAAVGVRSELRHRPAAPRTEFVEVVTEVRKKHPGQVTDDILWLDQNTGKDMALIAVWTPEDSPHVRTLLEVGKGNSEGTRAEEAGPRADTEKPAKGLDRQFAAMCQELGYQYVDLDQVQIPREAVDSMVGCVARDRGILPLSVDGTVMTFVASDPLARRTIDRLGFVLHREVELVMATQAAIPASHERYYGPADEPSLDDLFREFTAARAPASEENIGRRAMSQAERMLHFMNAEGKRQAWTPAGLQNIRDAHVKFLCEENLAHRALSKDSLAALFNWLCLENAKATLTWRRILECMQSSVGLALVEALQRIDGVSCVGQEGSALICFECRSCEELFMSTRCILRELPCRKCGSRLTVMGTLSDVEPLNKANMLLAQGRDLLNAGSFAEACTPLRLALRLWENHPEVLLDLSVALRHLASETQKLGTLEEAVTLVEKAVTLYPEFGPAKRVLASMRLELAENKYNDLAAADTLATESSNRLPARKRPVRVPKRCRHCKRQIMDAVQVHGRWVCSQCRIPAQYAIPRRLCEECGYDYGRSAK